MSAEFLKRMFGLDGQIAVVIGGTGRLGGAIAEGLGQAGATVIVAGRSESRGYKRVDVIRALGASSGFMFVDATSRDSVHALLDRVLGEHGRVDMLVNCAGVGSSLSLGEIKDDAWRSVMDVAVSTREQACQAFAPAMAKQDGGGSILNIGCVAANLPNPQASATSTAIANLTKSLAREYASRRVRVNVLCAGLFVPATSREFTGDHSRLHDLVNQTPMARFGEPAELVGPALLLLSRRAGSFVTGAQLNVDGGIMSTQF